MASVFRNFIELIKETGNEFADDHATKLSASLAYYTIFSIGPLLLVVITILGNFYKREYVTTQIFDQVSGFIGTSGAAQLKGILDNISTQNSSKLFGIIGAVVFFFGATSIFTEIQSSINYAWSIKAKPKRSWLKYIIDRLLSFLIIICIGLLMVATLIINLAIDLLSGKLHKYLGHADIILLKGGNIALLFVVVTFFFAVVFKVLPDAHVHWKDIFVGASFTGVLFLIGKFLITWYLSASQSINAYGAAASLIILLSWVYYTSLILYFGAEFTEVYARKWGKGITVKKTAVFIIKRESKELPGLQHPVQEN